MDTFIISGSACCLQYADVLLPNTLKDGCLVQESCAQRLLYTFTMPSSACSLQYAGCLRPSKLKHAFFPHSWYKQRGISATRWDDQIPQAATGKASKPSRTRPGVCAPATHATGISDEVQGFVIIKVYHPQCACVSRYIVVIGMHRSQERHGLEGNKTRELFGDVLVTVSAVNTQRQNRRY